MKKHKQGKSIITLLSKYYLAFTAMLFLLGAVALCAWTLYLGTLLRSPDVVGMLNTQAFQQGRYQGVDAARFLGRTGEFAVLDGEGKTIYTSSSLIPQMESLQDLYCIPESTDPDATVGSLSFLTEDGKRRLLLTQDIWTEEDHLETKVALLDEHNRVLEGSLLPGVKEYTSRQIGYLSGTWSDDYRLARWTLEEPQNNAATVLLLLPRYSDAYYQQVLQQAGRLWLLVIPIYFGATLIFVSMLNRHFRLPLARLNTAISRLGAGERVCAGDCGGSKELECLGQSFDEMARKILCRVGLSHRLDHFPSQMSGGQQQRAGIARAFVTRPEVVFADEPTGNLDSATTVDIMKMICGFAWKYHQTIILVTHDPEMAAYADRVVKLIDGEIVSDEMTGSRQKTI